MSPAGGRGNTDPGAGALLFGPVPAEGGGDLDQKLQSGLAGGREDALQGHALPGPRLGRRRPQSLKNWIIWPDKKTGNKY